MSVRKVKKEFKVWLKEDQWPYYEGSCIHVNKESKSFYYGIHSNMGGSFNVKFSKEICTKTNPMRKMMGAVGKYLKTPAGKKRAIKMKKLIRNGY